jgi:hypothetical protein
MESSVVVDACLAISFTDARQEGRRRRTEQMEHESVAIDTSWWRILFK